MGKLLCAIALATPVVVFTQAPADSVSPRAKQLHDRAIVVDSHDDTTSPSGDRSEALLLGDAGRVKRCGLINGCGYRSSSSFRTACEIEPVVLPTGDPADHLLDRPAQSREPDRRVVGAVAVRSIAVDDK